MLQVEDVNDEDEYEASSVRFDKTNGANNKADNNSENQNYECNKSFKIFLSYQWKAQSKIRKIYNELDCLKCFDVFMDIFKIKAGMNLYLTLASNIQQADVVIACICKEYLNSKNCEREIIFADGFNKPIIPLYLEKIPQNELGSIGFILIRERYCNMYKNENLFEALANADEFNDLLDGIFNIFNKINKSNLSSKSKLMRSDSMLSKSFDESNISQAVVKFRNDAPIEELFFNSGESSTASNNMQANIVEKKFDGKVRTNSMLNQQQVKEEATVKKFQNNYFRIHPVIKELNILIKPKVLLDPMGDRFDFDDENNKQNLKRGGMVYNRPGKDWIRYGLNVKLIYKDSLDWLAKDGNKNEWAVGFHGFKINPIKSGLHYKLFDKYKNFKPNFEPSKNLTMAKCKNINKNSDTFDTQCGLGTLLSSSANLAEPYTYCFTLNKIKYKMLLQCRINPTKIKIPSDNHDVYIVSSSESIKPYGLLIKEIA